MDPWGQGAEGGNEAKPPRSTPSGGRGKPGATKAAVALRRLPVSKEEFFVFSGIKQVFPSTYCVPVGASCNAVVCPAKACFQHHACAHQYFQPLPLLQPWRMMSLISIRLFLIAGEVLRLFTCLLAICFSPTGNCLSISFAHFSY